MARMLTRQYTMYETDGMFYVCRLLTSPRPVVYTNGVKDVQRTVDVRVSVSCVAVVFDAEDANTIVNLLNESEGLV